MRKITTLSMLFLLLNAVLLVPIQSSAHTASSFTVLVKENGFSQSSPEIFHNDSIIWHNTDNSSNLTHRLVYDHDGDGLYNGSYDWDSGELHAYCERDGNNTKLDETCTTSFVIEFDVNWTEGSYAYQDMRSDGTVANATIRLFKDTDSHNASTAPTIGSSFGVNDDKASDSEENDETLSAEDVLLYVAMGTGGSAMLLLGLLLLRKPENTDRSESE